MRVPAVSREGDLEVHAIPLGDSSQPEVAQPERVGGRRRISLEYAPVLAAVAAAAYLLVMRRPDSLTSPTLWAEDGTIYFSGAIQNGARSLLTGYAGQLFLAEPRSCARRDCFSCCLATCRLRVGVSLIAALGSCALVLSSRWCVPVPFSARRVICLLALVASPAVDEVMVSLAERSLVACDRRARARLPT